MLNISELEKNILKFWEEKNIFEKSVERPAGKKPRKDYVFFDGPPFATGTPHYGHIVASVMKDAVPRYWTMKGYRVKRRWGWDCHGLPIENIAEKELGIARKKEIEKIGIEKFNEFCRSKVLGYTDEWKKVISRLGRWADMEHSYKTMDVSFMESVWWVFKELWDKSLIYEGYRSMHICTRCETTLSQQEVAEGYKNIKDISATVKFELADEPGTFVLAWTTTPWTLIGNVALAIGKDIDYVKIKPSRHSERSEESQRSFDSLRSSQDDKQNEYYILAKNRIADVIKDEPYEIVKEFKGRDLIGKKYKTIFPYYIQEGKIYAGDFVTTEEGTGVVHIAPAFGEDDFNLMRQYNLPFVQHVGMDGIIKPEAKEFAGMSVKPMGDHQTTDIEIIKNLAARGLLFSKEKYEHSYPHCWRCETPLINYATSSLFVNILKIKTKAIRLARGINWSPAHIKEGRFGKWLEGARDWSISRQRFWASVIPIWKCEKCAAMRVIGSVDDLKKYVKKSGNQYFLMRHGEAEGNRKNIITSKIETAEKFPLTKKGERQVMMAAQKLKKNKIDIIFASDFLRTRQTAAIVAQQLGLSETAIIYDRRLREIDTGIFDEGNTNDYKNYFSSLEEKFYKNPPSGENLTHLKNRIADFLYEIEIAYSSKNILIISHEYPIWQIFAAAAGADARRAVDIKQNRGKDFLKTAGIIKLDFVPLPHNQNFELDLHRPYIDRVELRCDCGGAMRRIPDVLDTWFDSGSMPYAQAHYPFQDKKEFEKNFPAEFIAEGVDQTRAWFYYLHSVAAAIKNSRAFDNVIVNGTVLAEDGQKMSKRLKNYPDPMEVIEKYGADALRLYLLSSPVVRAEDLNFSERAVQEVYQKTILRLWNTLQFYELFCHPESAEGGRRISKRFLASLGMTSSQNSKFHILDQWILTRLNQLISEITAAMENYELDRAVRPIGEFVDDLSTWYVRRSRERFKTEGMDKKNAIATLRFILQEFSKMSAPFAPFMAETIWQNISNKKSVHLTEWPKFNKKSINKKILEAMSETRKICSLGLEARQKAGIKVRQPLQKLKVKSDKLKGKNDFIDLIKEEINVKEVVFDKSLVVDVELDTKITSELKDEGDLREFTRALQDLRKKAGLQPQNKIELAIETGAAGKKFIKQFEQEIKKAVNVASIKFAVNKGEEIKIGGLEFKIEIKK